MREPSAPSIEKRRPSWAQGLRLTLALLLVGGCLFGSHQEADAIGKTSRVQVAQLVFKGSGDPRPSAIPRLMWEVKKRTSLNPQMKVAKIKVSDKALFRYPLVYISGDKAFPRWSSKDVVRLRSHLSAGGTLFMDMANGSVGGGFDKSARRLARRLFPRRPLKKLPRKHTLFRSFYLIRRFGGRVLLQPSIEGVILDDRSPIIYSVNDLSGAWERDNFGNWVHPVLPGGSSQREHAFRLGLNILFYALCVNYKQDLVHVPYIMKRRK